MEVNHFCFEFDPHLAHLDPGWAEKLFSVDTCLYRNILHLASHLKKDNFKLALGILWEFFNFPFSEVVKLDKNNYWTSNRYVFAERKGRYFSSETKSIFFLFLVRHDCDQRRVYMYIECMTKFPFHPK